jgi:hypothetical protein
VRQFCEHGCWMGLGCRRCEQEAAFWWGFRHPFGPPRPWWSKERRRKWFEENGKPWRNR